MPSINPLLHIDTHVLNDVVAFFNALPSADKIFEPHQIPVFQPMVVHDGAGNLSTVFGDPGTSEVVARLTYVFRGASGTPHAIDREFLEVARYIDAQPKDLTTTVLTGEYVGDQPLQNIVAGFSPITSWVNNLDPTLLKVRIGDLVMFSVRHWVDATGAVSSAFYGPTDPFTTTGLELVGTSLFVWIGGEGDPIVPMPNLIKHIMTTTPSAPSFSPVVDLVSPGSPWYLTNANSLQYIRVASTSPVAVMVPTKAVANWKLGTEIHFEQVDVGQISILGEFGVNVQAASSFNLKSKEQFAVITLKCVADDVWTLFGLLEQV